MKLFDRIKGPVWTLASTLLSDLYRKSYLPPLSPSQWSNMLYGKTTFNILLLYINFVFTLKLLKKLFENSTTFWTRSLRTNYWYQRFLYMNNFIRIFGFLKIQHFGAFVNIHCYMDYCSFFESRYWPNLAIFGPIYRVSTKKSTQK